jgi:hypothetical protein
MKVKHLFHGWIQALAPVADFVAFLPPDERAGHAPSMEILFTQALGLSTPWRVGNVEFRQSEGRIVFQIENTATWLEYPACGAPDL